MRERPADLLIDTTTSAEAPSPEDLRAWAADKRIFVSSVIVELREERKAAAAAISEIGAQPALFEDFGGRDDDPQAAYLNEVASSDIYVGILGRKYGKPLPTRFSATHAEYREAEEKGLRIAAWAKDGDREGPTESFLEEMRVFHVVNTFTDSADLKARIGRRLRQIGAEDIAPWVKLGNAVFRCQEIHDRGSEIEVVARLRDVPVAQYIEGLRPSQYSGGQEVRFTWPHKSAAVRVVGVESRTTSTRGSTLMISLERHERGNDGMQDFSTSAGGRAYSADDITEVKLKHLLFGEPNPLGEMMGSLGPAVDPLASLRGKRLSEDALRAVCTLLLTEALVGSGRASRITDFQMGIPVAGQRRLRLSWTEPKRYVNAVPGQRAIDGVIRL